MTRFTTLMIVACTAIGLVACGGDDGSSDGSGFTSSANASCLKAAEQSNQVQVDIGPIDSQEKALQTLEELEPIYVAKADELDALEAPEEDVGAYAAFTEQSDVLTINLQNGLEAAESGDTDGFNAAGGANQQLSDEQADLALEVDGLDVCAEQLSESTQADISEAIDTSAISDDPELVCEEYATQYFLDAQFGGLEGCLSAQEQGSSIESTEITNVRGYEDLTARADVELIGGPSAGDYRISMSYEDGTWKINELRPLNG